MDTPIIGLQDENYFSQEELFRIVLIKKSIEDLCKSMLEELKREKKNILQILTGNNKMRQIESLIAEVQNLLESEDLKRIDKIIWKKKGISRKKIV